MVQNSNLLPFLPFENAALTFNKNGAYVSFGFTQSPPIEWQNQLDNIQTWRPSFLRLQHSGFNCQIGLTDGKLYDGGFLMLSKHKLYNQQLFLQLLKVVKPQGTIIICGDKNLGVQSMRKWVSQFFDIDGNLAKYHGQCFWFTRPDTISYQQIEPTQSNALTFDNQFTTEPGMFSHGKIDPGSQLLIDVIPSDIRGQVADFGAGWGFIAARLLQKFAKISQLDLFEADYHALEAAKNNLAAIAASRNVTYNWYDLLTEKPENSYDWIISNPPFHEGRSSDSSIGQNFIAKAFDALKPKGQLMLVANRQLPYERLLSEKFHTVEKRVEQQGFKVIYARK
ncbi:class I SAM-dependent methyltransferase [Bartonella sp. HY329]|uniref:class I SAM-dependent methyltransferase n=1 Tax=unclassified Bartonella TaxID=2645622 RepID=UPI0021C97991|nr:MULTISPECIES: class I SAM-dependent methyltransferase [unclassified Bartonella]UXM95025.1 class I SAM-dependent methyltransferase [Bartonella sp. HY329]UXN09348.1 class I SAM-dependent methyltransferase [Bartonella sp. HY328]